MASYKVFVIAVLAHLSGISSSPMTHLVCQEETRGVVVLSSTLDVCCQGFGQHINKEKSSAFFGHHFPKAGKCVSRHSWVSVLKLFMILTWAFRLRLGGHIGLDSRSIVDLIVPCPDWEK